MILHRIDDANNADYEYRIIDAPAMQAVLAIYVNKQTQTQQEVPDCVRPYTTQQGKQFGVNQIFSIVSRLAEPFEQTKGHVLTLGEFEYFVHRTTGNLYRAPTRNLLDVWGYRQGARFECMAGSIDRHVAYLQSLFQNSQETPLEPSCNS